MLKDLRCLNVWSRHEGKDTEIHALNRIQLAILVIIFWERAMIRVGYDVGNLCTTYRFSKGDLSRIQSKRFVGPNVRAGCNVDISISRRLLITHGVLSTLP